MAACSVRNAQMKSLVTSKGRINVIRLGRKYASIPRKSAAEYCMEVVRKYDYENYLCSLLLPKEARAASFAIRALNTELAQVKDQVSNPAIGQMRIEFWKETLDNIFKGNPPQQPIALELTRILQRQQMSKHFFSRLIDSREQTLTDKPYQTISELEEYADRSVSPIYYLLLQSAGVNNMHCDHAASHLGKCQGILNHIRAIPYNSSRNKVQIPIEILTKNSVSEEDILRTKRDKNIRNLIYDIASVAHQHLNLMQSLKKDVPKEVIRIFLPAVACESYLSRLQKEDFNVFSSKLQQRNSYLPMLLWWRSFLHKY